MLVMVVVVVVIVVVMIVVMVVVIVSGRGHAVLPAISSVGASQCS
jgi:hypothetical protein